MITNDSDINFGIVSDVQYARQESPFPDKRPAPMGIKKLTKAIDELNQRELAFIVNLGDTIDRDATNFPPIMKIFEKSKHPVWHALGNHDFAGPDNEKGHKEEALKGLGLTDDNRYYMKDMNEYRFIVLDTNEVGVTEHKKGTPEWKAGNALIERLANEGKINAHGWNGALGQEQLRWLEQTIDDAKTEGRKSIIFAHHPIYPKHRDNLLNNDELLAFLKNKKSVKAYINGHNHDGNYGIVDGLHCWTIEGMMDYEDKTAYAVAHLEQDRIIIEGLGRVADRVMELR